MSPRAREGFTLPFDFRDGFLPFDFRDGFTLPFDFREGRTLAFALAFLVGCSTHSEGNPCSPRALCDTGTPSGPILPVDANGRVGATALQAWPNRPPEPAPLTPMETARACAMIGACVPPDPDPTKTDFARSLATTLCADPNGDEERAIPVNKHNERWSFEARAVITSGGSCAAIKAVLTDRPPGVYCEEDGCWWTSLVMHIPSVTCAGSIATLSTNGRKFTRDCSRAFQRCDPSSATGCSDRKPIGCVAPALDRCDGNIKLGCDGTGRVSFHDCTLNGGTCSETPGGATCLYPNAGQCTDKNIICVGTGLSVCVQGAPVIVDCVALGLGACSAGHCVGN